MGDVAQCAVCAMGVAHGWQIGPSGGKITQGKIAPLKIRLTVVVPTDVRVHTDDATGRERMPVGWVIGHDAVEHVKRHSGIALDMGDDTWPVCRMHARETDVSQPERLQPTGLPVSLLHETDPLTGERVRLHVLRKRNRPIAVDPDITLDEWQRERLPFIGRLDDKPAPPITGAQTNATRTLTRTYLQATHDLHTVQRVPMGYAQNVDYVRLAEQREKRQQAAAEKEQQRQRALAGWRARHNR